MLQDKGFGFFAGTRIRVGHFMLSYEFFQTTIDGSRDASYYSEDRTYVGTWQYNIPKHSLAISYIL